MTDDFEKGLQIRKELVGEELVVKALSDQDDFAYPMQQFVTEHCWGAIWSRPGLDRRSRSLLNIGMLAAANRPDELAGHIRIGIKNGLRREEVQEALLQVATYLGMPAGIGAFKIAKNVFDVLDKEAASQG